MPEIEAGCAGQAIAEYLLEHPAHFDRCPEAFPALALGHSPGGGATSLAQRQVARLRRGNGEPEARIEDRTEVARRNRALADRMHRLTLQLLALDSAAERIERLRVRLWRDFSVYSAARVPDSRQRRSRTLQSPPARGLSAPARRRRHRGIGRVRRGRAGRGAAAGRRSLIACR